MIVSEPRADGPTQRLLFERMLGNHGHRRCVVGALIERLTALTFGGRRHKCTGLAEYCPDVSIDEKIFLECKAMGRSRQTFVYAGRLEKDRRFANEYELYYVIWHHKVDTTIATTVEELEMLILSKLQWVAVIPFDHVEQLCLRLRNGPTKLNSGYGSGYGSPSNKLYGSGYRIPMRFIEPWILIEWECQSSG